MEKRVILKNKNYDIMYHVSPLLKKAQQDDEQSLDRKRFIGNDLVVIVFKEQSDKNDLFDPTIIESKMNQIFIVVSPTTDKETNQSYTVSVISKESVIPFPPFIKPTEMLPIIPIFPHNEQLKTFMMNKIINAEKTALLSDNFNRTKTRVLQSQVQSVIDQFGK